MLRKPFRLTAFAVLLAVAGTTGGVIGAPDSCLALDLPPLRAEASPAFTADVAVALDSVGTTGLSVAVSLPYSELQWIRLSEGYGAGLEVAVVFEPQGHGSGYGDSWERTLAVPRFDLTTQHGQSVVERRSFQVPPGRYEMRVVVQDLNSGRESSAHERIEVPDYSRIPLAIAGLELGRLGADDAFEPVTSRRYGFDSDRLAARLALVDRRPGQWPRDYVFAYRILDESGAELNAGRRTLRLMRMGQPALLRPDSTQWFVGNYTFEITLEDGKGRWRVDRAFEVEESGPPRGREFRRMLEPLSYIASPEEYDNLSHLPDAEQAAGWDKFWRRRDPTPDTPRNEALLEFMRRVRYAEEHFQHFGPGWRSDMGRIYIKFGPPDQTESRAATSQSPQVEIWYYNQPYRQFVFADRDGFGRFVLVSPGAE